MSTPNPDTVITEEKLQEFYDKIFPYLGGSADAGFTPVGSVIAIMGVTAPANYLACNGQVVKVADYPELANYFEQQFGAKYKFGGSGTTFGIPDLRGEFLRGTGSNGHTYQGSGADVGVHQDSTRVPVMCTNEGASVGLYIERENTSSANQLFKNFDAQAHPTYSKCYTHAFTRTNAAERTDNRAIDGTVRPTNTSILWCIATKDIYLNPSMDYSTEEKIIGTWIDGKPIYQKTFSGSYSMSSTPVVINDIQIANVHTLISEEFIADGGTSGSRYTFTPSLAGFTNENKLRCAIIGSDTRTITMITLRYTKTT